jgi:hypothetical protein
MWGGGEAAKPSGEGILSITGLEPGNSLAIKYKNKHTFNIR